MGESGIRTVIRPIGEVNENPTNIVARDKLKDKIGDLLGYARCECGKSFLYADTNNPGIYLGGGTGKSICNECYLSDKEEIEKNNKERMGSEVWVYGTDDVGGHVNEEEKL